MSEASETNLPELATKPELQEEPPKKKNRGGTYTRRGFLGLATLTTGGIVASAAERKFGAVSRLIQPDIDDIPQEVPPQLQGKEIPYTNEHYKTPLQVVRGALNEYVREGGQPFYKRPDYYLTTFEAIKTKFKSGLNSNFDITGKPYEKALIFSAVDFNYPEQIYDYDPGTGARALVEKRLQDLTDNNDLGKKQVIIAETYAEDFNRTKKYIDNIRGTGRVSTKELLKYFLQKNNGNIVQSLWDATLFTKLAARVDMQKMSHFDKEIQDPEQTNISSQTDISGSSRKSAELLSSMFYDEFSSGVPLEWLLTTIPPEDKTLNTDDRSTHTAWKDFMPVNRAGTPYHVYNLIACSTFMDPNLVEESTTEYYSRQLNPYNSVDYHGRIKVAADMVTVHQARDIRKLFETYKVD